VSDELLEKVAVAIHEAAIAFPISTCMPSARALARAALRALMATQPDGRCADTCRFWSTSEEGGDHCSLEIEDNYGIPMRPGPECPLTPAS